MAEVAVEASTPTYRLTVVEEAWTIDEEGGIAEEVGTETIGE